MEWKHSKLGDVVTLQRGFDLPERERREGFVPIVSSSGVSGYHDVAKVDGPGVVTGRYGTLGQVFYIPINFWPLNTTLFVRDYKGNDRRFIGYFLKTLNFAHQNVAGAVPGVNRNYLHELAVTVPPPPTQRKIAAVLSAYDDLIENNQRRIAILEEMARNLYREWFVDLRFPGHEHVRMVDGVPEGWARGQLGTLVREVRRSVNPEEVQRGTPYVGLEHIPRKSITLTDWGAVEDVQSTKLYFKRGEILFGKIRPYFHKVVITPVDGVCSSDAIVIVPREDRFLPLALACVSSEDFVDHATQTSQGTKMPRANWDVLVKYPVAMPTAKLLAQFNEFMGEIVAQTQNLMFRNRNLRRTRDLLLPKLISGELDVAELEIAGVADV